MYNSRVLRCFLRHVFGEVGQSVDDTLAHLTGIFRLLALQPRRSTNFFRFCTRQYDRVCPKYVYHLGTRRDSLGLVCHS
jgi:hypothetical protein